MVPRATYFMLVRERRGRPPTARFVVCARVERRHMTAAPCGIALQTRDGCVTQAAHVEQFGHVGACRALVRQLVCATKRQQNLVVEQRMDHVVQLGSAGLLQALAARIGRDRCQAFCASQRILVLSGHITEGGNPLQDAMVVLRIGDARERVPDAPAVGSHLTGPVWILVLWKRHIAGVHAATGVCAHDLGSSRQQRSAEE